MKIFDLTAVAGLLYNDQKLRMLRGNDSVVECHLAKVKVAGSSPVSRSKIVSMELRNHFIGTVFIL